MKVSVGAFFSFPEVKFLKNSLEWKDTMDNKKTTLDRLVKGFCDGTCTTTDFPGVVFSRLTGIETAGRYGMYNKDTHASEMGRTAAYRGAKAAGAVGGAVYSVAAGIATGGMSIVYTSAALNGIKATVHAGSWIYNRVISRTKRTK